MSKEFFVFLLFEICSLKMYWGFRILPGERWQMLATLPIHPLGNGQWQGLNLTWYGLLTANAYLAALAILIVLLGASEVPLLGIFMVAVLLLSLCVPASRLVARIVEGKAHTFTVGGAVFVGIIAAPWIILLVNRTCDYEIPVLTALAAIAVAYAFGEGLGRLGCISYGCCYGKPLSQCRPLVQRLFQRWNFTFHGETRKAAYASDLEGKPVVPIQAITAILYTGFGLLGTYLFLRGEITTVFVLLVVITQVWRILSEIMRDDYRGENKVSAYQVMGLLAIPYAIFAAHYFPEMTSEITLATGIENLWKPGTLVFLQSLWLILFFYTGRSTVTGANLSYHVHHDRI